MSGDRREVRTEGAPAPIGPYSQAIEAAGLLFCSGQIPLDPVTGEMLGGGDVAAETEVVLRNLTAVLAAGGCTPSDVVRTTIYLVDMGDFPRVNEVYGRSFGGGEGGPAPARATVAVAALPKGARVEIDAVAVKRR